jgi:hypothetical protein
MRSPSSNISARRARRQAERRTRRRPAIIATGLALGLIVTGTVTGTAAASQSHGPSVSRTYTLASAVTPAQPVDPAEVVDAQAALTAAQTTIAAAGTVTTDIAASGIDIGVPDTAIDTAPLEAAAAQLEHVDALPEALVPEVTDDVAELAASVDSRVSELRSTLDGALAAKAAAEAAAAEQARLEAEAAAAAAAKAAKAAKPASSGSGGAPAAPFTGGGSGDNSPAGAQASARAMLAERGWGDDQFQCLVSLWNKESGWNYQASNRSSGAYGIPQALPGSKMASAGADWQTNAATQVAWGLGYISGRYGTPCGAWSHSQSTGWY